MLSRVCYQNQKILIFSFNSHLFSSFRSRFCLLPYLWPQFLIPQSGWLHIKTFTNTFIDVLTRMAEWFSELKKTNTPLPSNFDTEFFCSAMEVILESDHHQMICRVFIFKNNNHYLFYHFRQGFRHVPNSVRYCN
jgi:hypothetical protein